MVNLYLAEFLSRERTAEVERKARRYAALHPIPEQWLDSSIEESQHWQVPVDTTSARPKSRSDHRRKVETGYRCAEAWRRRRACFVRRQSNHASRERVSGGHR